MVEYPSAGIPGNHARFAEAGESPVPVNNIYHDTVIRALTANGWTNTHDPLSERFGQLVIARLKLRLLVFDDQQQRVVQWIG